MKRLIVLLALTACQAEQSTDVAAAQAAVASASRAPALTGPAAGARDRVADFVRWASNSGPGDAAEVRRALGTARGDAAVISALADHAIDASDHSRALVALALLGEMKSPLAEQHLRRVVGLPLPPQAAGEDDPRAAVEMLAAKAVDGLAYMGTAFADAEVLRIAAGHASRAVRAEAVDAYLYNHGDSAEARAALAAVIPAADRIFLDRPRYVAGETAEQFDARLAAFLAAHPEVQAPPMPAPRKEAAR